MFNDCLKMIWAWNKFLPELVMPLTVGLVLLIVWRLSVRLNLYPAVFWTGVGLIYLASSPVLMWIMVTLTEYNEKWKEPPPAHIERVVVPGGILAYKPEAPLPYSAMSGVDRLIYGVKWADDQPGRMLYLAGGSQPGSGEPAESGLMKQFIEDFFEIDPEIIETDSISANTIEHARKLEDHLAETGGKREIILVTSAQSMARAIRAFEARGFEVHPYATDYTPRGPFFRFPASLLPSANALNYNSGVVREWLGRIYYMLPRV